MVEEGGAWVVLSLGGSLIVPDEIDTELLSNFSMTIRELLQEGYHFIIVSGGGQTARQYQEAARTLVSLRDEDLDWLGIHSTRLNAHLLRTIFKEEAAPKIITNPQDDPLPREFPIILGAGWKPGWSTDYDAAILARRVGAQRLVNLSNVAYVSAEDPKHHPNAKRWTRMSWQELRGVIGTAWHPGMHLPFDPVAARLCEEEGLSVAILDVSDWENVKAALRGAAFRGTLVSREGE